MSLVGRRALIRFARTFWGPTPTFKSTTDGADEAGKVDAYTDATDEPPTNDDNNAIKIVFVQITSMKLHRLVVTDLKITW